jgi:hypothetical protein
MENLVTKEKETGRLVKYEPAIVCGPVGLVDVIFNQKSATFLSVVSNTECRMNKTGNPYYGLVRKVQKFTGMVGDQYEKGVQKKADKEGLDVEFKAQPLRWGEHWRGHESIIYHNGKFYLQVRVLQSNNVEYQWNDGTPLTEKEELAIREFFPQKKEGTRQPAEEKVIYRTVSVENITEVRMMGIRFVVTA